MNYIKIETSDRETRWINLDQVRRVTLAEEVAGELLLAVIFDERETTDSFRIHGTDATNRAAIEKIVSRLNELAS